MRGIKFPIVSEYNPKGFKQATKGVSHFKKSLGGLKGVLGGLGLAFGAGQLALFGMAAAKAAQADIKSQQLLVATQKKSAHATDAQTKKSEAFVQTLSNQVGLLDDDLRPSLGNLTRSTGSVGKAQKLLKIALNASAASGKPLKATVAAVSKAFNGQTGSLTRLFPELKNSKDALKALDDQTRGMAAIKADPFTKFTVATDNLKESLGALILPKLTSFMEGLMAPGGSVDQLGQFLKDAGNPKTDAGKAFKDMGDGLKTAASNAKNFLAVFNADSMSGFLDFARRAATVFGIAKGAQGLFKLLGAFGVKGAAGLSTSVAGIALSQYAASETSQVNAKAAKKKTGRDFVLQPGGIGQGLPSGLFQPGGMVINVYGKATKADAEEVIRLVREHERRNGTAWRK